MCLNRRRGKRSPFYPISITVRYRGSVIEEEKIARKEGTSAEERLYKKTKWGNTGEKGLWGGGGGKRGAPFRSE